MSLKEIRKNLASTTEKLDRVAEQLGDLGNKFGSYTAGLLAPSVRRVLQENFGAESVQEHLWVTQDGESQEFDLLGVSRVKKSEVVLAEIKSKLTESELKKFEKKFADFFHFMPEHRGKTLKGLLAVVEMPESMERRVANRGFYLMRSDAKSFELLPNPKDFRPRTSQG